MRLLLRGIAVGLSVGVFAVALTIPASAVIQTFSGPPAGTVAAGDLPGGGTAPGTLFPDFTLSVVNNSGPQSLLIFDSSNPTGEDPDLGTPNQTCPGGGPGVGIGGEVGQPGENCVPRGNLLIIAEDIVDSNNDGLVDDPDDDLNGGTITFHWNTPTAPLRIVLMDIDNESAAVAVSNDTLLVTVDATDLGNNSAQTLDLTGYPATDILVVRFSSSGAVAEIEYDVAVQTRQGTWGQIKGIYR
jgi:hypothetical protein